MKTGFVFDFEKVVIEMLNLKVSAPLPPTRFFQFMEMLLIKEHEHSS